MSADFPEHDSNSSEGFNKSANKTKSLDFKNMLSSLKNTTKTAQDFKKEFILNKDFRTAFDDNKDRLISLVVQRYSLSFGESGLPLLGEGKNLEDKLKMLLQYGARADEKSLESLINEGLIHAAESFLEEGFKVSSDYQLPEEFEEEWSSDRFEAISEMTYRWKKYQKLAEDDGNLWADSFEDLSTRVKSVYDIEYPNFSFKVNNSLTRSVQNRSDVFWMAARSKNLGKVLDFYIKEKQQFPFQDLVKEEEGGFNLMTLLAFTQEDGIWDKVMNPDLWRSKDYKIQEFFEKLPLHVQGRYDLEKTVEKIYLNKLNTSISKVKPAIKRRPR